METLYLVYGMGIIAIGGIIWALMDKKHFKHP